MTATIPETSRKKSPINSTEIRSSERRPTSKASGSRTTVSSRKKLHSPASSGTSKKRASSAPRASTSGVDTKSGKKSAPNGSSRIGGSRAGDLIHAPSMLLCPSCNEPVQPTWKRCPHCESQLLQAKGLHATPELPSELASTSDESPQLSAEVFLPIETVLPDSVEVPTTGWAKFRGLPIVAQIAFWAVGLPIVLAVFLKNRGRLGGAVAVLFALVGSLIYYPAIIAIAGDGQDVSTPAVSAPTSGRSAQRQVAPPPPMPSTKLEIQSSWAVVDKDSIELTGVSQQGVTLRVEWAGSAQDVAVAEDGSFKFTIGSLPEGETSVVLTGITPGHQTTISRLVITRQVSEQRYKADATSVPYDQLNKDPAAMAGRVVTFKAKVFQYDSRTSTAHMMVEVTPGSYGFWDDLVYLNLDPQIAADVDEDDVIQFWGTVKGAYTYGTAIGGSNTLPEIDVKYMKLIEKMDD